MVSLKSLFDLLARLFSKRGASESASPVVDAFPISEDEMRAAIVAATFGRVKNAHEKAAAIRAACARSNWTDRRSIAHALVHGAHESRDFSKTEEDLNYSESRLLQVFPTRVGLDDARRLAGNPYAIAEQVYGNRPRLGNTMPGDGYAHRGIFWPQLTGGDAHRQFAAFIGQAVTDLWSLKDDIATNAQALVWFATKYKTAFVETAATGTIEQSTRLWNGGLNGLADRAKRYVRICAALGIEP